MERNRDVEEKLQSVRAECFLTNHKQCSVCCLLFTSAVTFSQAQLDPLMLSAFVSMIFKKIWIICQLKAISISLHWMPLFRRDSKNLNSIEPNSIVWLGEGRCYYISDPSLEASRFSSRHVYAPSLRMFNQPAGLPWRWRCCAWEWAGPARTMTHLQRCVSTHSVANGLNGKTHLRGLLGENTSPLSTALNDAGKEKTAISA